MAAVALQVLIPRQPPLVAGGDGLQRLELTAHADLGRADVGLSLRGLPPGPDDWLRWRHWRPEAHLPLGQPLRLRLVADAAQSEPGLTLEQSAATQGEDLLQGRTPADWLDHITAGLRAEQAGQPRRPMLERANELWAEAQAHPRVHHALAVEWQVGTQVPERGLIGPQQQFLQLEAAWLAGSPGQLSVRLRHGGHPATAAVDERDLLRTTLPLNADFTLTLLAP